MLNDLTKKKIKFSDLLFKKPSKEQEEARAKLAKPEHDKLIESALRVL
jgi:hypothetical protein